MDLPAYFLVDSVPVKAIRTDDGGIDVLAFDARTGGLVREMRYMSSIFVSGSRDVRKLSEPEFEAAVERARRGE